MFEKYNYLEAVTDRVREYIENEIDLDEYKGRRDELEEQLNDDLWAEDSVTGNGSGSYWFNSWKSAECVAYNWDLLGEALQEFGCDGINVIDKGYEWADVTIRCYVLGQAISEALDYYSSELEDDYE